MISKKELHIICQLRADARKSLAEIARDTKIPMTTIYDAIDRLRRKGIIRQYVPIIDFGKIGFGTRIALVLKANRKKELLDFLSACPNVNSIMKTTGSYDFFVDAVFRDITCYESFRESIGNMALADMKEYHLVECLAAEKARIK
jgi:DNA-binding Lrp family transcriptional regulator